MEASGGATVHVVGIPRQDAGVAFRVGLPRGMRQFERRETVSAIATHHERATGERVLAAINGSFFGEGTSITGPLASEGELIVLPNPQGGQEVFSILADGTPVIFDRIRTRVSEVVLGGTAQPVERFNQIRQPNTMALYTDRYAPRTGNVDAGIEVPVTGLSGSLSAGRRVTGIAGSPRQTRGEESSPIPAGGLVLAAREERAAALGGISKGDPVAVRIRLDPPEYHGVELMICGIGWLLRGGELQYDRWDYHREFLGPQPRSALAFNEEHFFLVAVDGRGAGGSPGMTLEDLALFLRDRLGAVEALNLDGGASSTLLANGSRVNNPAGFGIERPVANALLVVERPSEGLPFEDRFRGERRDVRWQDLFSPAGLSTIHGRQAMIVRDASGGTESASVPFHAPANYRVEADFHLPPLRPSGGFERIGLFARDDGRGAFLHPLIQGNALAITWDTDDGRLRVGPIRNGQIEDSLPTPRFFREEGWHRFAVECDGPRVRYYLNGELLLEGSAGERLTGGAGAGHREFLAVPSSSTGAIISDFRITPLPSSP